MVTDNHYRWDFIMLSTDTKPTPATSKKVTNGSTLYTSDDSKLYVWYKDQWYEKTATGGGGGTTYTAGDGIVIGDDTISVDLAQSTGSSTTKVMSQKATTDFVDGLIKAGSQPTTSTVGTLGQLYEDTTNGTLYQCTSVATSNVNVAYVDSTSAGLSATIDSEVFFAEMESIFSYTYNPSDFPMTFTYIDNDPESEPYWEGEVSSSGNIGTGLMSDLGVIVEGNPVDGSTVTIGVNTVQVTNYEWSQLGGGGGSSAVTELTTDDYDYNPYSGQAPNGVALWRLSAGLYHSPNDVQTYAGADRDFKLSLNSRLIIIDDDGSQKLIKVIGDSFTASSNGIYKGFVEYSIRASDGYGAYASASTSVITSGSLMIKQSNAPTSANVGYLGQLWYDSTNNKLYINVNRPSDYSGNWKEITLS